MNDDPTTIGDGLSALAWWGFVLACIVLTAGTPDLLDQIIAHYGACKP